MDSLDKIDKAILRILQRDGSIKNVELCEILSQEHIAGLDQSTIARRRKGLEEAGYILGYRAILNLKKLGLPQSVLLFVRFDDHAPEKLAAFEATINAAFPNVVECMKLAGEWDYALKLVVRDMEHLDTIWQALGKAIPIRETRTYPVLGEKLPTPPVD